MSATSWEAGWCLVARVGINMTTAASSSANRRLVVVLAVALAVVLAVGLAVLADCCRCRYRHLK